MDIKKNTAWPTSSVVTISFAISVDFSATTQSLKLIFPEAEITLTPAEAAELAAVLDGYAKWAPTVPSDESLSYSSPRPNTH